MAYLSQFAVENFRIIERAEVAPSPTLNFFFGPNASGKSSLVEAIYFLGRARSFRETHWRAVRREGTGFLRVTGEVAGNTGKPVRIGVERNDSDLIMRIDRQNVRSSKALLEELPLQLIQPESHRLIEEGPAYRRQFLDWGVFHVEHRFFPSWQRYRKAWQQRNAALKSGYPPHQLEPWEAEMDQLSAELDQQRARYIDQLLPLVRSLGKDLLDQDSLTLRYHRGWSGSESLAEVLKRSRESDRSLGFTRFGPHRADLVLYLGEQKAVTRVSRGQQKLLVFCLILAQAELLARSRAEKRPVLLVDDLSAELDATRLERVLGELNRRPLQVFITGTEPLLYPGEQLALGSMFHVKHGEIMAVV